MQNRPLTGARSRLLQTLRDDPAFPSLLRTLQPAALARLVERVGLNDAGDLMALAPIRNLLQALDESLWKSPLPGGADVFDADELVDWLEAWNEIGDEFVADRLAAMSDEYRALCLSHLVSVGVHHTLAFLAIPDDEVDIERDTLEPIGSCVLYGPYRVAPAIEDAWDVVHASLDAMWTHCPECLLHTLGRLDGAESMLAAQESRQQLTIDIASERERHRENLGYVTAPGACAFLLFVATASMEELAALRAYDEETRRHLATFGASDDAASPIHTPENDDDEQEQGEPEHDEGPQLQRLRSRAGARTGADPAGRAAADRSERSRAPALTALLTELAETDQSAFERCARELAYLANVLKLGVRVRGATMSDIEARDAAYGACERGLERVRERGIEPRSRRSRASSACSRSAGNQLVQPRGVHRLDHVCVEACLRAALSISLAAVAGDRNEHDGMPRTRAH